MCGTLVKDRRFCPRCKWARFDIRQQTLLTYSGCHVGILEGGLPFLFPPDALASHMMIVGQTGTGKTRFAQSLITEIQNYLSLQPIRLLIIDIEGTYSGIIPYLKGNVDYYDVNSIRINPFDLKDPALIRELFRESVFKGIEEEFVDLSAQMQFVLQEAIAESSNMMELIDNIRNYSKRRLTSIEKTKTALMVRLDPFLRSPLKEIFMCRKSNPDFSKLGDSHAIIDLHALDMLVAYNSELRLIYNTIITYFLRKMLARDPTDVLSNVFVADEAQLLVPKILQKVIITQSWPATEFATRLRKRGCGLLLITQSPSNLEQDIFKNSATKIVFRLQNQEDIRLISDATGFVDMAEFEYLSNVIVHLQRKQAIVCTPDHEPFLMTARDFEPAPFNYFPAVDMKNAEENQDQPEDSIIIDS